MKEIRKKHDDIEGIKKDAVKYMQPGGFMAISPITQICDAKQLMEACGVHTKFHFSWKYFQFGLLVTAIEREEAQEDGEDH